VKGIETKVHDTWGAYYVLSGEQESGQAIEIVFSNAKLHQLLDEYWDQLVGKLINIRGEGFSFDRKYIVKLVG
jgi:hypothetical protein